MRYAYHVITPLARFENLSKLIAMLEPMGVQWHVITDSDIGFQLVFHQPWITHYNYTNNEKAFWCRCNAAINWMLDLAPLNPGDRYCILNDDDAYEPDFFKKLDAVDGELLIASMDRGHQTPPGVESVRAHGTNRLIAAPDNMRVGSVGVEQFVASGKVISVCRLPLEVTGDGMMIEYMVQHFPATYVPEASVWFNYYEPGRWNK